MNVEFAPIFKLGREEVSPATISDEKRDELRRRREHFMHHPTSGLTWDQVKQQARARLDRSSK